MAEVRTDFMPLLPLNNGVVLPNMVVTIPLEREEAQAAVAAARQGDGLVLLVPRVEGRFANFGTVAKLEDSRKLPNGIEVARSCRVCIGPRWEAPPPGPELPCACWPNQLRTSTP